MSTERKVPGHYWIPSEIRMHDDLRATDGFVFGAIYWYSEMKYQECTASNSAIGEAAGVSPTTASKSLSRLEKAGFIKRYYGKNQNRTKIEPLITATKDTVQNEQRGGGGVVQADNGGCANEQQNNSNKNNSNKPLKEKNIKKEKSPQDMRPDEFNASFFAGDKVFQAILSEVTQTTNHSRQEAIEILNEFRSYWTEPNKSGTKEKWEMEATFDVKRRLRTWFKNREKFGNDKSNKAII